VISTKHRFLFIHIPKVAGMSVNAALEQATYGRARRFISKAAQRVGRDTGWKVSWPLGLVNVYPPHLTALDWNKRLSPAVFDSMYKFAFVRNPWDWQVSLYHYILQDPKHHQNALLKSLGSFGQYLEWRVTDGLELQKSYLTDETGRFLVNFVGRYERLADDFQHVCRVLNLKGIGLPHINASSHRDYRTYYNARGRKLVEEHFQDDIATFGYTFDSETAVQTDWCRDESPVDLAVGI
jgi:hypothetical protein